MPTNTITFDDLMKDAADLGAQAGAGVDVQIKFMLKALEGGYHNAISLDKNKHGTGIDDAQKLSEAYFKARNANVVFDAKADNQRKLMSTVRTAIKFGGWTKGGQGEPIANTNKLLSMRQTLKKNPSEAKKLDDAANTFLKYARQQMKRDTLMGDDELKGLCYKATKDEATMEEQVEQIRKKLDKLIAGGYKTKHVVSARHSLSQELSDIAKARNPQIVSATDTALAALTTTV